MGKKLFDYVIGNPPYQEEFGGSGENKTYGAPVYNQFMDATYGISDKVELVHPGRFLFNAGSTPKAWNEKMLKDPHFKVLKYEANAKKIFPNAEITGGIAISYHDNDKNFGAIEVFTPFDELNAILHKVTAISFQSMQGIVISRTVYRLTDKLHMDHPEAVAQLSKGHMYDMSSNIFDRLPQVFFDEPQNDRFEYIRMLGRKNGNRTYRYIRREYVKDVENLDTFKIVMARADGAAGTIGNPVPARILGMPIVEEPRTGTTESFLSIGSFNNRELAENALKYTKSKFMRTLVSVLKTTQDITPDKWKYVPLQDFTENSDIDWSKSIHDIDLQLYRKYGLDEKEIAFIESHVKEMA